MPNYTGRNVSPYSVTQNFLTSAKTIKSLLSLTNIDENDYVVEIGPGKGHITRELAELCGGIKAVEADRALYEKLSARFADTPDISLICGDFLSLPLPRRPYKVFASIPFNITSGIMRKLTLDNNPPQAAWLIMEYGAAKRFAGKPYETKSSLLLKPFFKIDIIKSLPRGNFHPMPSVDCAFVSIVKRQSPDLDFSERGRFEKFVEGCQRRGIVSMLTKKQVSTALRQAGLPMLPESGNMLYVQWLCLFRCWRRFYSR